MSDHDKKPHIPRDTDESERAARDTDEQHQKNPPHTTTGKITSPKFGSAGSGGLEYEGNLEKD